ncbi:6-bladed beta-propeller [Bacteroides sp.]|uniref:6-bladed beta-propeller n=1 Tax=Bacteroides sp. TaxID=29523 RepID=UPI0025B9EE02|nr:6-bladed beta-propeller [Bacteroides sp.]
MKRNILLALGITILLYGCTGTKSSSDFSHEIMIDVEQCLEMPLQRGKIVSLETSDSSLLYDIVSIDQIEDKYFIRSRNKILTFDTIGNYLYNISRVGQGDKEYLRLSSFFVKRGELYLYDMNLHSILVFAPSGRYLRTEKIMEDVNEKYYPYLIHPYGKDKYIAKNQFNGTPGFITPALSLLNEKYAITKTLEGHTLHTGFVLFDFMNCDDNGDFITYWEALNDTIYTVVNDNILQPKYLVNFGEYSIPTVERLNKDVYGLIDYVNKPENKKIATLIRYVYEEEDYLYFVFSCEDSVRLALYNKETRHATTYALPVEMNEGKYRLASFLKVDKDKVIMALEDCENIENNQSLFIIDKKELYEK